MPTVITAIDIEASPERVWSILRDTQRWGEWNPLIVRFDGDLRPGAKIRATLNLRGKRLRIDAEILRVGPEYGIRWIGPAWKPMRALARGEHYLEIKDLSNGRTRFIHGERFSGPIFELLWSKMERDVKKGYEMMNRALKAHAESAAEA
jgi:hypothetical protein